MTRNYTMALPLELSPDEKLLRCLPSEAVRAMCAAPVATWNIGTGDAVMEFVHAPNPDTPINRLVSLGDTCTGPEEVPDAVWKEERCGAARVELLELAAVDAECDEAGEESLARRAVHVEVAHAGLHGRDRRALRFEHDLVNRAL